MHLEADCCIIGRLMALFHAMIGVGFWCYGGGLFWVLVFGSMRWSEETRRKEGKTRRKRWSGQTLPSKKIIFIFLQVDEERCCRSYHRVCGRCLTSCGCGNVLYLFLYLSSISVISPAEVWVLWVTKSEQYTRYKRRSNLFEINQDFGCKYS